MRVLITGATGFIGSRLAEVLKRNGHSVIGLTRDPQSAVAKVPAVDKFYAWDINQLPPAEALEQAEGVVNLVGETVQGRWTAEKRQRILDTRVISTRNLVKGMAASGTAKVLVNGGAVGYYGDRGDEILTEASSKGEGFLAEVVDAWEHEAFTAKDAGIRVASVRTGIVIGPGGGALQALKPLFNFGIGGPVASGKQWWPWVHLDDVCGSIELILTHEVDGIFNLTAPEPERQKAFAKTLGRVMHRPSFVWAPGFAIRLIQGGFADEVLFSKRVLPKRLEEAGYTFSYPALEPALRQILEE